MTDEKVYFGEVVWFQAQKGGYGFIAYDIDGAKQKDMFVHYSDISMEGYKTVFKGQKVSFSIGQNIRGEPKAINVTILKN